ncbi:MAG: hypothetical protein ABL966_00485 [Acidimicrobiales bacterium]
MSDGGDSVDVSESRDVEDVAASINELFTEEGDQIDVPFVVTVRRGGGWFVSPFHTLALYLVEATGYSGPDYEAEPAEPLTDDEDPAELFDEVASAVEDLDVDQVIAAFSVGEFDVLTAYRDAIEDAVDELEVAEGEVTLAFDDLKIAVGDEERGSVKVVIEEADLVAADSEEAIEIHVDGLCVRTSSNVDEPTETCVDREVQTRTGIEEPFLMMSRDGGGWRVDPVATVLAYADLVLSTASDDDILRALNLVSLAATEDEVTPGDVHSGTTNEAGFVAYEVALDPGLVELDLDYEDYVSARLVAPGGAAVPVLGSGGRAYPCSGPCLYDLDEAGMYRLVLVSDKWEAVDFDLTVGPAEVAALGELPGNFAAATQGDGQQVVFSYASDGTNSTGYSVTANPEAGSDDGGYVDVIAPDGENAFCGDLREPCTFDQSGTYYLVAYFESAGDHVVTVAEPEPVGFRGGALEVSGTVPSGGGFAELDLTLPDGAFVTLTVIPSGFDVVVEVSGPDGVETLDQGYEGDSESVSFDATGGVYTLLVSSYDSTDGGSFTAVLDI